MNKTIKLLVILTASFTVSQTFADGFFKKLMSSETLKAAATEVASATGNEQFAQVKSLLELVNEMPKDLTSFCDKYANTETLDKLVTKMKAVDLSACDADVKTACDEVVTSTEKVSKILAQMPDKSTLTDKSKMLSTLSASLQSGDATTKAQKLIHDMKECFTQLNSARAKLTTLAMKKIKGN